MLRVLAVAASVGCTGVAALELTLERAVEHALRANPAVINAGLAQEGERVALETARSDFELRIIPTGTLGRIGSNTLSSSGVNSSVGVQVARRFETGTALAIGPAFNRYGDERNTGVAFSLEQPLLRGWDGTVTLDRVRRSQFGVESAARALQQARIAVALEAIGAYHAVLRERRLVAFMQQQRARIERHALIAQSKERSGLVGAMDGYRAAIRLKDAEDALNQARGAEAAATNRLRRALALPADSALQLAEPRLPTPPALLAIEEAAAARRPEVLQARAELAEARRLAEVAQRNLLPDLVLRVSAGQATQLDPILAQVVPATQRHWSVSLQASTDLSRTAERNAWRQALLRVDAADSLLQSRIEDARRQVRDQWSAVREARERIALREEQIAQADSRLALAQVKFSHDMASNLDVVEAEGELQRAQASIATARMDYAVGVYQLLALAGTPPEELH